MRAFVSPPVGGVPAGTVLDFASDTLPAGYLACDGSNVSRSTYAALFAAIGVTWGVGDGATTFGLPDLRRRATVGKGGTGTATLGNAVGNTGGAETHTLTEAQLASHTHSVPAGGYAGGGETYTGAAGNMNNAAQTSGGTGGGTAHNILQPSAVVSKMIKT